MSPNRWTHLLFPEPSPENLLNDSVSGTEQRNPGTDILLT
jgi:hypothetical protein